MHVFMSTRAVLFALAIVLPTPVVLCAGGSRKKRKMVDGAPEPPKHITPSADTDFEVVTISVTITPYSNDGGVSVADAARMNAVEAMLHHTNTEMLLRMANGDVEAFFFARERGEDGNKPHSNGHYDLKVGKDLAQDKASLKALIKAEQAWMKRMLEQATDIRFRLLLKRVNPKDRKKVYGYDMKDQYKPHYLFICAGLSDEWLREAAELWLDLTARNAFTSKKCDKTPDSDSKLLAFSVGNLFVLVSWFIAQHRLKRISKYLTPAIIIAWALQTRRYRLDDALVNGKNGGVVLDPRRAQAFYDLGQLTDLGLTGDASDAAVTLPLIETILFGAPQPMPTTYDTECILNGIPTTTEFASEHNLASAKALCRRLEQEGSGVRRAPKGGRFLVIDFLSTRASALAATTMEEAGLAPATLFNMEQLPDACGYLAAGWACLLRDLGLDFQTLDMETASSVNTAPVITTQNERLGNPELGATARWLSDDDVLTLVDAGDPSPEPNGRRWLSGPGPINYWRSHFARTVTEPRHHGRVHIMIVNTDEQYDVRDSGSHWFLAAWYIEPDPEEESQQPEMPRKGDEDLDDAFDRFREAGAHEARACVPMNHNELPHATGNVQMPGDESRVADLAQQLFCEEVLEDSL